RDKLTYALGPIGFHRKTLLVSQCRISFTLKKDLRDNLPPQASIKWLEKRKNPGRQLLLFVPTIALAENMREKLAELLVKEGMLTKTNVLVSVHAQDPDREDKIQLFREKKIPMLITTTILER